MQSTLKHRGREVLMKAAGAVGLGHCLLSMKRKRLTIPVYHRIGSPDHTFGPIVTASRFEAHMRYLSRFSVVCLREVTRGLSALPKPAFAVTFDDGWSDFATHATPMLQQYHVPATVFIVAGLADTPALTWADRLEQILQRWEDETIEVSRGDGPKTYMLRTRAERIRAWYAIGEWLVRQPAQSRQDWFESHTSGLRPAVDRDDEVRRIMSWAEARGLPESLVEIGSHGMTHEPMETLSREAAIGEFEESKQEIERQTGLDVTGFSYTNDSAADWMPAAAEKAGYQYACRVAGRSNTLPLGNRYMIHRVHIRNWTVGQLSAELSPLGDASRRLRHVRVRH